MEAAKQLEVANSGGGGGGCGGGAGGRRPDNAGAVMAIAAAGALQARRRPACAGAEQCLMRLLARRTWRTYAVPPAVRQPAPNARRPQAANAVCSAIWRAIRRISTMNDYA